MVRSRDGEPCCLRLKSNQLMSKHSRVLLQGRNFDLNVEASTTSKNHISASQSCASLAIHHVITRIRFVVHTLSPSAMVARSW